MYTTRIAAILAVFLFCQGYCRPDQMDSENDYADDDPPLTEYEDDGSDDDSNGTPTEPPEIRTKPLTIEARVGQTVELPCLVVNADEFAISWFKGSEPLIFGDVVNTNNNRIASGPDHGLIIYNVTKEDSSNNYACKIMTQPPPQVVHSVHVTDEAPKNVEDLRSINVYPGELVEINENGSITLRCETKLRPEPEIKWFFKGGRLNSSPGIEVNGNNITLIKATRHHSGHYQCLVEDKSDIPLHESIEVLVKFAPVIEVDHAVVHTGLGLTTELACKVHAHPRAKVIWTKNDKPVVMKNNKKVISEEKSHRLLTIHHTNKHDLGTYKCVAKNSLGETSKDILVSGTPMKPEFIGGEIADDETTMILKWNVKSFAPIVQYKLEYRKKGDHNWIAVSPSVRDGNGNQFVVEHSLKGLQPSVSYEATLMAENDFGWSPGAKVHTFSKEYASDEPQNVKGSDASTTRSLSALTAVLLVLSYISTNI